MEPFKNLINEKTAEGILDSIRKVGLDLDQKSFLFNLKKDLSDLELKGRVIFLAEKLHTHFQKKHYDYSKIAKALTKAFENERINSTGQLSGFQAWPVLEYVSLYGVNALQESLPLLKEATKVFTSEFAVRPFLIAHEKKMLDVMTTWSLDSNEHVRRLASEGTRPLLPWGMKLEAFVQNPTKTLAILENLKSDESLYVRKSVANHLNDHSKKHPDLVLKLLKRWKKEHPQKHPLYNEVKWMIKHALRTLIKKNHPEAFKLIGIEMGDVSLKKMKIKTPKVSLGENLIVEVVIENKDKKTLEVVVDHDLFLLRNNGSHNIKCFKGKRVVLKANEEKTLVLKIPIKKVTTRTYYTGKHYWTIKLNGIKGEKKPFHLLCP